MGWTRTAGQLAATLGVVALIQALPWVLAAGSAASVPTLAFDAADDARVGEVVWLSAPEADAPDEPDALPESDEPSEVADADEAASTQAGASTDDAPTATSAGSADSEALVAVAVLNPTRVEARPETVRTRRAVRPRRVARPARELTKKEVRKRKRRARRRERLARQPQCSELIDQIVPVSDDEFWVGRELANCYRAHPRQFARIGGLRWEEDEHEDRVGLRVLLSSRSRGDVARAVGFQRGDVLRSLNGVPLRSTAGSGLAMFQLLGGKAKVTFLRDGEERRVVLRVVGSSKLARARARARQAEAEGKVARR